MISAALLALVLAQGYYTPEEAQEVFRQANQAYSKEQYVEAESGYLKLLTHGQGGADVLFNLGTAYLKQGKLGEAVLYLERAKREGRAPDVEANLALARARQLDAVIGAQASEPFVQRLATATNGWLAGWLFLISWAGGFALLLVRRWLAPSLKVWGGVGVVMMGMVALPSGALTAAHAYVRETIVEAVVLAPALEVREFPNESAKVSFEVHAGLKVRVLERSGRFVRIELPNQLEGWVANDGVESL